MSKAWYAGLLALFGIACSPTVYTRGVPNLVQVDRANNIWRSGQPVTAESWLYLKSLGITRIVKLNYEAEGSDQGARDIGLEVIYAPIEPSGDLISVVEPVDPSEIERAITALRQQNTLVHCTHGQDRTGGVVGAARVVIYHWPKSAAWKEMLEHNFHWELPALMMWWLDFDGKAYQ